MNQKEIWKDIPNYEGYYQVSNLGRVKSLSRKRTGKNGSEIHVKEKILKANIDNDGYLKICLYNNGNSKTFKIHKLVAITFLNHKPIGNKLVVDHIDNDKLNNMVYNLQIITQRQNLSKNKTNKSSNYIGVSRSVNSKKWVATIYFNGRNLYLGSFKNEIDAAKKYKEFLNKHIK